jgi:hypothetical protein
MTRETVITPTFASRATSMMVGLRACFVGMADFKLDSWEQLAVPTIADSKLFPSATFFNHVTIFEVIPAFLRLPGAPQRLRWAGRARGLSGREGSISRIAFTRFNTRDKAIYPTP